MLVRECLRSSPVTVPPECTVREAAQSMQRHGVGCVLVVDAGDLVGIATDRDITLRCVAAGGSVDDPVESVMTEHPVVIQGSADVAQALVALREGSARRLPVLEDDELAGIVTVDDLLVALVVELGAAISPVAREIAHPSG